MTDLVARTIAKAANATWLEDGGAGQPDAYIHGIVSCQELARAVVNAASQLTGIFTKRGFCVAAGATEIEAWQFACHREQTQNIDHLLAAGYSAAPVIVIAKPAASPPERAQGDA